MEIDRLLDELVSSVAVAIKKRGLELYIQGNFVEPEISEDFEGFEVGVIGSSGEDIYDVLMEFDEASNSLFASCTCAYFETNSLNCKHIVAAAFQWKKLLKKIPATSIKPVASLQLDKETQFRPLKLEEQTGFEFTYLLSSLEYWQIAEYKGYNYYRLVNQQALVVDSAEKSVSLKTDGAQVSAKYVDLSHLTLSCSCGMLRKTKFCAHAITLIDAIVEYHGPFFFRTFQDNSAEIAEAYNKYGVKPGSELAKAFKFGIDRFGTFTITDHPVNLLPLSGFSSWQNEAAAILPIKKMALAVEGKALPANMKSAGLLINLGGKSGMPFWIDGLIETEKKHKISYKKLVLHRKVDLLPYSHLSEDILVCLNKITSENLLDQVIAKTGLIHLRNYANPFNQMDQYAQSIVLSLFEDVLVELLAKGDTGIQFYAIVPGDTFTNQSCQPVQLFNAADSLEFHLTCKDDFWVLTCMLLGPFGAVALREFVKYSSFLKKDAEMYLLGHKDAEVISLFKKGDIMIHQQDTTAFLEKIIKPLQLRYPVIFGEGFEPELNEAEVLPQVYLSELNESFLMIRPKWRYGDFEAEMDGTSHALFNVGIKFFNVVRERETEEAFVQVLKGLHPQFKVQTGSEYFYLPFKDALEKSWFMNFFAEMQKLGVKVYGVAELKKFKYNSNSPSLKTTISSGIDWFDMQIEVHYGDQVVGLAELKRAILNKQEYVLLKDGTFGILPEEWIKKYSSLFKMGKVQDDLLQVSKFHYTLLDELHSQLDDVVILKELIDKKQRLQRIGNFNEVVLPSAVKANLRDYQLSGFQWLAQLEHIGWGGCLADDMGLGKTLQALAFLQHRIVQYPEETHLIVCPTSLLYNWETEIQKFTPDLSYHIYYGAERAFNMEDFKACNLIISSYGMVRSDIEHLIAFQFGYVVLDESQNIKNPSAQITKAVQLLKAVNRLTLSGTPIQNNTFDLYAQMNFLNPGMLGNMEFFKSEFATPIDKYNDRDKSELLKKMVSPFMLRRTKEQVAKDLPDKTEMVLWCEMEDAQRSVYNEIRKHYRETLLERIEEGGMGKNAMYILEGLLRLRQICDSTALLKDDRHAVNSVKMKELLRELTENTGTHKSLIFSQFTEMLALIRIELDKLGIKHSYLDGSTPAHKRKEAVDDFQNDDTRRIFLISLKAGGVGLNLTSADYVYLVDPWWNPAAEQQAIDRTHRIGQKNKIFAYKMICKDTVEEKIIQLQDKKKALAGDLIADESGFVKKLTKEDVVFLFS